MQNPVVSREEWMALREALLQQEKRHTRERERLAKARRELPWVRVDKVYTLGSREGPQPLPEVFGNCSQLVVYHLMFGADWDNPCDGCTQWADAMNGTTRYLERADARLIAVSSAPVERLIEQQQQRGWTFPWLSSSDSDFNRDFHGASDDPNETSRMIGHEEVFFDRGQNHGVSVFYKNADGDVFHTYSCYNRGIEEMNGAFGYFDVLPKGRAW